MSHSMTGILTTWNVSKWTGTQFVADGVIPSPNASFKEELTSTATVTDLVDGDICIERPLTKTKVKPISLVWKAETKDLKIKLENYLKNSTKLRLECKGVNSPYNGQFISGTYMLEGEFLDVTAEWMIGIDGNEQLYDITAMFQPYGVSA